MYGEKLCENFSMEIFTNMKNRQYFLEAQNFNQNTNTQFFSYFLDNLSPVASAMLAECLNVKCKRMLCQRQMYHNVYALTVAQFHRRIAEYF